MSTPVPSTLKSLYDAEGFVVARNVLDEDIMGEVRNHLDWLIQRNPGVRPEKIPTLVRDDAFLYRIVGDDRLLDIAEQFIGSNIALFATQYFVKPPFDGLPVPWHQDGSYWPLDPQSDVVSLWLAVDRATVDNGCLQIIRRSHKSGYHSHAADDGRELFLSHEVDPSKIDENLIENVELQPGDISIHHPQTVHGSRANYSSHRRAGLTIRYIPTSTRVIHNQWAQGLPNGVRDSLDKRALSERFPTYLLRGHAVPGVNDYAAPPRYDRDPHFCFGRADSLQE